LRHVHRGRGQRAPVTVILAVVHDSGEAAWPRTWSVAGVDRSLSMFEPPKRPSLDRCLLVDPFSTVRLDRLSTIRSWASNQIDLEGGVSFRYSRHAGIESFVPSALVGATECVVTLVHALRHVDEPTCAFSAEPTVVRPPSSREALCATSPGGLIVSRADTSSRLWPASIGRIQPRSTSRRRCRRPDRILAHDLSRAAPAFSAPTRLPGAGGHGGDGHRLPRS
jgi:hypothetical protein